MTGAELDQTSAIRALRYEILQNGFSACMKAQGYRVPGFQGDGPQHDASMPDLGFIKAHGFLIYGSSDAGVDLSTASAAARQAASADRAGPALCAGSAVAKPELDLARGL